MKKHFKNLTAIGFLIAFVTIIFDIVSDKNDEPSSSIKTDEQFDKSLSGIATVVDGDTIKIDGNRIRLVGLDAPEHDQICLTAKEEEYLCGEMSRKFLINLADKKQVECVYAKKDIYDRFLAKCYVGNVAINDELLKKGMAVIYNFKDAEEKMVELEAQAKEQKLGIWQGPFQLPKDFRKSQKRKEKN